MLRVWDGVILDQNPLNWARSATKDERAKQLFEAPVVAFDALADIGLVIERAVGCGEWN